MPKYSDSDLDVIFDDIYNRLKKLEAKMDAVKYGLASIAELLKREDL